jgi:opacity protein-like surface antigen
MKLQLSALAALAAASCSALPTPPPSYAPLPPGGDVDLTTVRVQYGLRTQNSDDDWAPTDESDAIGIEVDHRTRDAFVGFEIGTLLADGDEDAGGGVSFKTDFDEIYAGVRKTFDFDDFFLHPYVSLGLTWIQARAALTQGVNQAADDDSSIGAYGRVGVNAVFMENVNVGLEYRLVVGTDLDFFGVSTDTDYGQFGLSVGYSF